MSIAGLALASCTEQDEAIRANEGQAIDFRPAMAALTCASETTNANLKSCDVTAMLGTSQYFKDITFTKVRVVFSHLRMIIIGQATTVASISMHGHLLRMSWVPM